MIGKRVSNLSCSEEVLEMESPVYQDGLKDAGFVKHFVYIKPAEKPN